MLSILLLTGLVSVTHAFHHGWLDELDQIKTPDVVNANHVGKHPLPYMARRQELPQEEPYAGAHSESEPVPAPEPVAPETVDPALQADTPIPHTPKKPTNGNCRPEPKGYGPMPTVDTAEAWYELEGFTKIAEAASTPKEFKKLENATALFAAAEAVGFEGLDYMDTYNVTECAARCAKRRECISFNIYFERDPLNEPGSGCANPKATTAIKCVFWGNEIDVGLATNFGELREEFQVLVAGSNLYTKTNPGANLTHLGFRGPRAPRIKAVFEPPSEPVFGYNTTLGFQTYPYRLGFYYNPEVCAKACLERTENDSKDTTHVAAQYRNGAYDKCNMFTAFELHKGGVPHAMVCVEYSAAWDNMYGTWKGGVSQDGAAYEPRLVEVYTRTDYKSPDICADPEICGNRFYEGGDCSGWGAEFCSTVKTE